MVKKRDSELNLIESIVEILKIGQKRNLKLLRKMVENFLGTTVEFLEGIGEEILYTILAIALYPTPFIAKNNNNNHQEKKEEKEDVDNVIYIYNHRPVLLVHGYMQNSSSLYVLKRRLEKDGWKNVETIDLHPIFGCIRDYAKQVAEKVESILQKTGEKYIDIVAHSMGGLVVDYYIKYLGGDKRVINCVTLGTPHNGTYLGALGLGKNAKQMKPGSRFINDLKRYRDKNFKVNFTAIWASGDIMVFPAGGAIPDGRTTNLRFDYVGHYGLIFSKKVYPYIKKALSKPTVEYDLLLDEETNLRDIC